jgi:hypothetical protein
MRIKNDALTLSGVDMEAGITSNPIWLGHIVNFSIQLVFTGAPNGAFKLQASNDEGSNDFRIANATITNWTDVANSSTNVSAAGSILYNIENSGYRWVRLVWTDSASDTSAITVARYNVKGI